jgi:hypothetical protein
LVEEFQGEEGREEVKKLFIVAFAIFLSGISSVCFAEEVIYPLKVKIVTSSDAVMEGFLQVSSWDIYTEIKNKKRVFKIRGCNDTSGYDYKNIDTIFAKDPLLLCIGSDTDAGKKFYSKLYKLKYMGSENSELLAPRFAYVPEDIKIIPIMDIKSLTPIEDEAGQFGIDNLLEIDRNTAEKLTTKAIAINQLGDNLGLGMLLISYNKEYNTPEKLKKLFTDFFGDGYLHTDRFGGTTNEKTEKWWEKYRNNKDNFIKSLPKDVFYLSYHISD